MRSTRETEKGAGATGQGKDINGERSIEMCCILYSAARCGSDDGYTSVECDASGVVAHHIMEIRQCSSVCSGGGAGRGGAHCNIRPQRSSVKEVIASAAGRTALGVAWRGISVQPGRGAAVISDAPYRRDIWPNDVWAGRCCPVRPAPGR